MAEQSVYAGRTEFIKILAVNVAKRFNKFSWLEPFSGDNKTHSYLWIESDLTTADKIREYCGAFWEGYSAYPMHN